MSTTVDANVLIYASDAGSPHHDDSRRLLDALAAGPELIRLFWPVVMAYLRITTHASVFSTPLTPSEAEANVGALTELPHVKVIGEGDGFWNVYKDARSGIVVRGNLVTDAHIVALMRQHGVKEIWTKDRDFAKFPGIKVRDPATFR